jgi:hypothetical protein
MSCLRRMTRDNHYVYQLMLRTWLDHKIVWLLIYSLSWPQRAVANEGRQADRCLKFWEGLRITAYISLRTNSTPVSSVPTLLPSSVPRRACRTAVSCLHCSATCNWIACHCESGWVRNMRVHRQKEKIKVVVNNGVCLPRRWVISTHAKRKCSKEMLLLWENICLAYQESEVSSRNFSHCALQLATSTSSSFNTFHSTGNSEFSNLKLCYFYVVF